MRVILIRHPAEKDLHSYDLAQTFEDASPPGGGSA
jgi:hypothetical protein